MVDSGPGIPTPDFVEALGNMYAVTYVRGLERRHAIKTGALAKFRFLPKVNKFHCLAM